MKRQSGGCFTISVSLILPHIFRDQVFAVFPAEPTADILAAATTGTLFFTRLNPILRKREQALMEKQD